MSLDGFSECKTCKQHLAAVVWIQAFRSIDQAKMHGQGPDFLSALMPGPGMLKIELCWGCQIFRPCLEFTDEEKVELEKFKGEQQKRTEIGEKLGGLFGGLM